MKNLGLAQLAMPSTRAYKWEYAWVQRTGEETAKVLSVCRFTTICQFGDIVRFGSHDGPENHIHGKVIGITEAAGYFAHVISSGIVSPIQAMNLSERMLEAKFHMELWSLTMRLPNEESAEKSFCAGLALGPKDNPMDALIQLRKVSEELGLKLYAPSLAREAGDELGAYRDERAIKRFSLVAA